MKKAKRLLVRGKILLVVFTTFFFALYFISQVYAVTVTVSDIPSSISSDPFTVKATISGAGAGTNYLRIDLYKEGTSNYFGETNNTTNWYNGSDGKQYYPATIVSGVDWSGTIQGRIGSPSTTDYDGAGSYRLRVRRYTTSGSAANDPDNSVAITIAFPTNTPVPTNTPTPQNTPTPTKTPTPQNTPTPTKTPTPTPTIKVESTVSPTPKPTTSGIVTKPSPTKVLGIGTKSAALRFSSATPPKKTSPTTKVQGIQNQQDFLPLFFIGGGIVVLLSCAILTFRSQVERLWKRE